MAEYLRQTSFTDVPRFAPAAHRPARRRLYESESSNVIVRMMIGDAIGDAFGFGIEMQDAHWIRKAIKRFDQWPDNPVLDPRHRENNVRGFYSDDAEMTVGLMKGLVKKGIGIDKDEMLEAWREEFDLAKERPPPAIKGRERQGHGSAKYVWNGKSTIDEVRRRQAEREDPGNAPPMRALPVAWIKNKADRERLSIANADTTHPHPKARATGYLMAHATRFLAIQRGQAKDVISNAITALQRSSLYEPKTLAHLKAIDALPDYHEYGDRFCDMPSNIHELLCGPQPNPHMLHLAAGADGKKKMEGLGSDAMRTLACVLYILKYQTGPLDALTASIDLGGDVDSVAALVLGAIAATDGLKFGEKGGLSWKLLEELEGVEYLMKHAKEYSEWLEKQGQNGEEEEEAALMPTLGRGAVLTGLAVAAVAVVGMVAWRRR